jgi:hypothetical protein
VYSYAPGRGGEHAAAVFEGYAGVLHTDGYAGYRALADPKRLRRNTALSAASTPCCWKTRFEMSKPTE